MTNAHLEGYDPEANIRISKGLKFRDVISRLLPGTRQRRRSRVTSRVGNVLVLPCCGDCIPILQHRQRFPAYTSFNKQLDTLLPVKKQTKKKTPSQIKAWLETHRPLRKRFPRNPYTVNNIDDVWEIDSLDLSSLKYYNNNYRYLLQVIDVFSKYLHSVPLRTKTGKG